MIADFQDFPFATDPDCKYQALLFCVLQLVQLRETTHEDYAQDQLLLSITDRHLAVDSQFVLQNSQDLNWQHNDCEVSQNKFLIFFRHSLRYSLCQGLKWILIFVEYRFQKHLVNFRYLVGLKILGLLTIPTCQLHALYQM